MRTWPRSLSGHSGTGTRGLIATSGWVMKKTVGTEFLPPSRPNIITHASGRSATALTCGRREASFISATDPGTCAASRNYGQGCLMQARQRVAIHSGQCGGSAAGPSRLAAILPPSGRVAFVDAYIVDLHDRRIGGTID